MQLANYLKVPVVYFFEGFPGFSENVKEGSENVSREEDLNYSFLAKLFTSLSDLQKEKILQVLKNTRILEKIG